jgi:hypothetical protein
VPQSAALAGCLSEGVMTLSGSVPQSRLRTKLVHALASLIVAVTTLVGGATTTAPAAMAAPAAATSGWVPEYYQFCYDRPPFPSWVARSWYKNAIARADGVECQHYVQWADRGLPMFWQTYYDWNAVCRSEGFSGGWWDGRYPRCW